MNFGYADPPYIGQSKKHYGHHPDYAGEVDHGELIARLEHDFDGWALSASMKSLPVVLRFAPTDVLTLAWVKPNAMPMGDHRIYTWEPVILRPCRRPDRYTKTHLELSVPGFTWRTTPAEHVIGEKPEGFAHWIFDAAGLVPGDTLDDLFPGSGAVGRAWHTWQERQVRPLTATTGQLHLEL